MKMKPYSNKNYKFVKSVFPYPSEIPELFNLEKEVKSLRKGDLFLCIRPFLLFGKCIGLIPIGGIFRGDLNKLTFSKCSVSGVITLTVICLLTMNTGLALAGYFRSGGRDATQLAKNGAGFICYMIGLYVFIFIFRNSQKIIDLMREWRASEPTLKHYNIQDKHLRLTINLVAGIILTSAIAENAVSHLLLFPLANDANIMNHKLEYYYTKSHPQWAEMIPYNPVIAIIVFLCNKWAVYAWNFGDIFIVICSRALYGRFKSFYEDAVVRLASPPPSFDSSNIPVASIDSSNLEKPNAIDDKLGSLPSEAFHRPEWIQAIDHHEELCRLHEAFASMLSPLIFASYIVNIYFICIQLHLFLVPSPSQDFIAGIYGGWSFLHLLLRTYIVSLTAAKVHDYAHAFGNLMHKCPHQLYRIEIERAEKKLSTSIVALNGLGTFSITRPFILSVLSVIFTLEIVLLQTTTPLVQMIPSTPNNHNGSAFISSIK